MFPNTMAVAYSLNSETPCATRGGLVPQAEGGVPGRSERT
jgi:hypothetical protein